MRVCVMAYKFYEESPRVMMFANALARRGDSVDVVALRRPGQSPFEEVRGVRVHRIQERTRNERSRLMYLFRVVAFFVRSAAWITKRHVQCRYELVHVFSIPDFLVFAAAVPRMLGSAVVLDCGDLVPEFYASKFKSGEKSLAFKLLTWIERLSIAFSHHAVLPIEVWRDRVLIRSALACKCSVIRYHPDPAIFFPRPRTRSDDRLIFIYPGTLNVHQGLDVAIRAFERIAPFIPKAEFHIYGEGPVEPYLRGLVETLGLAGRVIVRGCVPAERIAAVVAECDIGVVPKRASMKFGNEAPSTKILEFMALGIPVIASRTDVEQSYLDDSVVQFFTSDDERELAHSMLVLLQDHDRRRQIAANATLLVNSGWEAKQEAFFEIVNSICSARREVRGDERSDAGFSSEGHGKVGTRPWRHISQ